MFHLHRLKGEERLTPFHFFTILDRDRYDAAGHWRKDRAIEWAVAACRMVSARRRERPGFAIGKHQMFVADQRSEEHTSELQSLMRTSYAVFCLKKKNTDQ